TSDANGAFTFEGLVPARWRLSGGSNGYIADGRAIVSLAKADVDGVVVRVRGVVEVAVHVEPREVCDVDITEVDARDSIPRHDSSTTSSDGSFRFGPFAPDKAT